MVDKKRTKSESDTSYQLTDSYTLLCGNNTVVNKTNDAGDIVEIYVNGSKYETEETNLNSASDKQKRNFYKEYLKKQLKNFIVLSGAGTSIGIGKGENVGLSMNQLWQEAEKLIGKSDFNKLCINVKCDISKPNLETLLSLIDGHMKYSTSGSDANDFLDSCKTKLLSLIKEKCNLEATVNSNDFPHVLFLSKITQRKATLPRVKIFTLNYDLLFEQAANAAGAVVLDGFSFVNPRTFSGRFFDYDIVQREKSRLKDEDNFISRLFHLYKLHGSLNWEKEKDGDKIFISANTANPLMVYPRESKYENSYEQPFFEMMARFHQNLRLDNTLLLCIGYSFNDKHINAAIEEALNQNPGFQMVIVNPKFDKGNDKFKLLMEEAKKSERIMMIDETFKDFATHFPEIQTYNHDLENTQISL